MVRRPKIRRLAATDASLAGDPSTERVVAHQALSLDTRIRAQREIIGLFGSIDMDPQYNYKEQRRRT